VRQWNIKSDVIEPSEYRVSIVTVSNAAVRIVEDERGVWIEDGQRRDALAKHPLRLPRFEGHPDAALLRQLHHEVLINIVDGKPVPNLFVYERPWYRDAASMCMVLRETGNLDEVREWTMNLSEPFDRNAHTTESDNIGQALYMISLVSDQSHPLVPRLLEAAKSMTKDGHLTGTTDGVPRPGYQTKWLKFGLRSLGLADTSTVPVDPGNYSALTWWMDKDSAAVGPRFTVSQQLAYPYLLWAEAHFYGDPPPTPLDRQRYPLSYEAAAKGAYYPRMKVVSPLFERARVSVPHGWAASEMFLYLLDRGRPAGR
ncbi:MAG: hypothetical protein ACREJC_20015, partial [Tepidisphaeraceae bacterium]